VSLRGPRPSSVLNALRGHQPAQAPPEDPRCKALTANWIAVARRSDVRRARASQPAPPSWHGQRAAGAEAKAGRPRLASVVRTAALPTGGDADQSGSSSVMSPIAAE
jgi:hypothetical protein